MTPWMVVGVVVLVVFLAMRSGEIFCVSVRDGRIARPSLGQVLGIAWLAWMLDRSRDFRDV